MDFAEFVNMVLANHTIQELLLRWQSPKLTPSNLMVWISGNVRILNPDALTRKMDFCLPDALEVLKLAGPFHVGVSNLAVRLPKLSDLDLSNVLYESDDQCLPKLISGCPVLQSLRVLDQGFIKNMAICTISCASLKSLRICFTGQPSSSKMMLEIDAPALQLLHLTYQLSGQISVRRRMNQLGEVHLDVPYYSLDHDMFEVFRVAKILRMSDECMRAVSKESVSFERLLALNIRFDGPGWHSLADFIDSCFNLQYL